MATYAKASYNAAKYAANRPTYPLQLFEFVFRYHKLGTKARFETAVDLGCGPGKPQILSSRDTLLCRPVAGQATLELTPFKKIIGVDPSSTMIEQAQNNLKAADYFGQVEYRQSSAEYICFMEEGSVDLITSGVARCYHTERTTNRNWSSFSAIWSLV